MLHRHFDLFDQEGGQAENRRIENAGELKQLRELSKDPLFLVNDVERMDGYSLAGP